MHQNRSIIFRTIFKERFLFLLIVTLNMLPVLVGKYFPTLDGPAHLYNSQIINSILFQESSLIDDFFQLNRDLVPNWTGHFILSTFNLLLPAFIAEKILILLYMIGLPFAFRTLVKKISTTHDNYFLSYLIFPFTYSFTFFLGFYNFSFALIFFFMAVNYWITKSDKAWSTYDTLKLFFLITCAYFSHIFIFMILILLLGFHLFLTTVLDLIGDPVNKKQKIENFLRKCIHLSVASIIPLFLLIDYFSKRPVSENLIFFTKHELLNWLIVMRPLIALNFNKEQIFTSTLSILILILFLYVLSKRLFQKRRDIRQNPNENLFKRFINQIDIHDIWLAGSIFILILYFKLPDSDGNAGYVSIRLGMLFYLFLILWISRHDIPNWAKTCALAVVLVCHFILNTYYFRATAIQKRLAAECYDVSAFISPNSIILPVNCSENWLHIHFSNYIGVEKPIVILENYECGTGYFPVKWNDKTMPNTLLGNLEKDDLPCLTWNSNLNNPAKKIDYVFVLGDWELKKDSCSLLLKKSVNEYYRLTYASENCLLYSLK